jgi:hypothetical protein
MQVRDGSSDNTGTIEMAGLWIYFKEQQTGFADEMGSEIFWMIPQCLV